MVDGRLTLSLQVGTKKEAAPERGLEGYSHPSRCRWDLSGLPHRTGIHAATVQERHPCDCNSLQRRWFTDFRNSRQLSSGKIARAGSRIAQAGAEPSAPLNR